MRTHLYPRAEAFEVEIDVEYTAIDRAAKISGPPEDCYPAESELSLIDFHVLSISDLCDDGPKSPLTLKEIEDAYAAAEDRIIGECWDDFREDPESPSRPCILFISQKLGQLIQDMTH